LTGRDSGDDTRYALTALISDMQPDAAILAVALSVRSIIAPYLQASPSLKVTEVECMRLVEDYAQSWSVSPLNALTNPSQAMDILEDAIEDIEYLDDLLGLSMNFLHSKDACAAELCALLQAQIAAHKMLAEQYLYALGTVEDASVKPLVSNVVAFPVAV